MNLESIEIDPRWWEAVLAETEVADAPELISRDFGVALRQKNLPLEQRAVLECLEIATSAMLDPECWTQPFNPAVRLRGRRSALPEDLNADQLGLLARIAPLVEDPVLRARVADVAWCFGDRGRLDLLDLAVAAYRSAPLDDNLWTEGVKAAWQRAYELLIHQGESGRARIQDMNNALRQRIMTGQADAGFMLAEVSRLLRQRSRADPDTAGTIAHQLRSLAASTPDGHRRVARILEREARIWFRLNRNDTAANTCTQRVAELYIADADSRIGQNPTVAAGASVLIEKAIAELTSLPRKFRRQANLDHRVALLRNRLLGMRTSLIDQMVRYETDPVDISGYVDSARQRVTGLNKFDAIAEFGDVFPVADSAALVKSARERLEGSLSGLFRSETLSHDGRKVAATSGSIDDEDARAWSEAMRDFGTHVELVIAGFVLPAQDVINFEHRWDQDFILRLCIESAFVQSTHTLLWASGLLHGFNGDYASAMLVLIPLLENSIRSAMKSNGVYTLLVESDGVESEKGLGALLAMPEAESFLGVDLTFSLRALLTERVGLNLRNTAAHGLLNDQNAWSYGAVYVWWLCLKLVVMPVWNAHHTNRIDIAEDTSNEIPHDA